MGGQGMGMGRAWVPCSQGAAGALQGPIGAAGACPKPQYRPRPGQQQQYQPHLVEVAEALEALDRRLGDVGDLKVGVQRGGEVKRLVPGVHHAHVRAQRLAVQRHREGDLEGVREHGAGVVIVGEDDGHLGVAVVGLRVGRGGGHGPVEVARKAVLLHSAGAKLGEAVRHAAGDGLGLVEDGVGADEEHLVPARLLPARHRAAKEHDLSARAARVREHHRRQPAAAGLDLHVPGDAWGRRVGPEGGGAAGALGRCALPWRGCGVFLRTGGGSGAWSPPALQPRSCSSTHQTPC